ncbi:MAG TPA: hypothetical protein VD994_21015 [Prosthecobacter sp.]|nr:hypothetical protein [Prosthecobacter sp.]
MNKSISLILGVLLNAGSLAAEMRTFSSPDGRTVEAEIVAATPDTVTLKLASGQSIVAPVTRFSTQDQEFIGDWRRKNPVAIKYSFAASYTKDKKNSTKRTDDNTVITTDTWVCNMKIANRSGQTLENVKVDYEVFYNQVERGNPITRKSSGTTTIESIKHLQELVIPTKELKLETSQLDGGFYYADGSPSRQRDSLSGMIINLSHEGKKVFSWASGGVPTGRGATAEGKDSVFGK